ncbi:efflux RND transporter periplasmic adaptor subunit [Arsenicitalea aurantiaca]|uniref:Efflux RND transporter periplasmic adaptor subunit n=1 Tax=Arsenicitalea aurantiaca TaxID=1783274 RepID=A0A433X841_9HYPH|nr:efflux RND transporter periplasmic adaptor subunit [Arsenicitalea aurantiaca]RUT30257.1 efflux RND transporter periplasmic adaptor subunit [Arsenicitalea aurantiaca]
MLWALAGVSLPAMGQESAVSCLILPWETIELAAPTEGIVTAIHAERGETVAEGQLLVQLNDALQRAYLATVSARAGDESALRQAQVRVNFTQSAVERNRPLFNAKLMTADEWEQVLGSHEIALIEVEAARAALDQARLEVDRAEVALAQTRITAPADAVVLERLSSVGEAAGGEPVMRLVVIDRLRVELFVSAESHQRWTNGRTVEILARFPSEARHTATVTAVDPVSDAGTGILRVQLALDNSDRQILAGQQCGLAETAAP